MGTRLLIAPIAAWIGSSLLTANPLGFVQKNLVSDGAVPAAVIDSSLKNPWGISFSPTTPFWISDNGSGLSTLYSGDGTKQGLVVTIPPPGGSPAGTMATPTGTVYNGTSTDFSGDRFIFATEDGTIAGWQGGTTASLRADNSAGGAVYKGLAIASGMIYATDFANGKVDVWNDGYTPLSLGGGAFTDPNLPSGYSPFGIQNLGGDLYVTYAKKEAGGDDDTPGPGFGFVDKYDTSGNLLQRVVVGDPGNPNSPLNSPWGLAIAPAGFGDLGGVLLVGNFGDGHINAFDSTTGAFIRTLTDASGSPLVIDGLWGLSFGNGGPGFDANKLYFTAGINDEQDGLFGSLSPVPESGTMLLIGLGLTGAAFIRRGRAAAL